MTQVQVAYCVRGTVDNATEDARKPKEGDLRVWWIPQVPMRQPFHVDVDSPKEASKILGVLAYYDLFQYENKVRPDYANVGGLEVFEDGEWCEWYDEDGDDIDSTERL